VVRSWLLTFDPHGHGSDSHPTIHDIHYSVKDWDLKPRIVSDEINSIRVEEGIQR